MKKLPLSLAILAGTFVSVSAFAEPPAAPKAAPATPAAAPKAPAAPKAAFGTGDFRRVEAAKVAGVKPENATVMGLATAGQYTNKGDIPKNIRVEAVSAYKGPDAGKVTLVKAPLDKSEPVTKVTTKEAHDMGLATPKDAQAQARDNGGIAGSDKKVDVKADGLAGHSYGFKQTEPSTIRVKDNGAQYDASNIRRSVSMTGNGESASFASKPVATAAPTPAPAAPSK